MVKDIIWVLIFRSEKIDKNLKYSIYSHEFIKTSWDKFIDKMSLLCYIKFEITHIKLIVKYIVQYWEMDYRG